MPYREHPMPARMPRELPNEDSVLEEEREDNAKIAARLAAFAAFSADPLKMMGGEPYLVPYYRALSYSPPVGAAMINVFGARKLPTKGGGPGTLSRAAYGLIGCVISFDNGYWILNDPAHATGGVADGLRIECLKALRDGEEEKLTDDERQQVQFIRAVSNCTVTDDIWREMVVLLGSYRGVVEYAAVVCFLLMHHRLMSAVGQPGMTIEAWNTLVDEFENGTRSPADEMEAMQSMVKELPDSYWRR